jgi:hypothetical protein
MMGAYAEHEVRVDDARAHWTRARTLFAGAGRWLDAAGVADLLAGLANAPVEQALADWRDAADLFVAAGQPGAARECVLEAHARLMGTVAARSARVVALAEAVRGIAIEHGLSGMAADLGQLAATMAIETPEPWESLAARFDRLRVEYQALGGDAAQMRLRLVGVDFRQGMAAAGRGRGFEAEPLLVAALEVFNDTGRVMEAEVCASALSQILAVTDRDRRTGPVREADVERPTGRRGSSDAPRPLLGHGPPLPRSHRGIRRGEPASLRGQCRR